MITRWTITPGGKSGASNCENNEVSLNEERFWKFHGKLKLQPRSHSWSSRRRTTWTRQWSGGNSSKSNLTPPDFQQPFPAERAIREIQPGSGTGSSTGAEAAAQEPPRGAWQWLMGHPVVQGGLSVAATVNNRPISFDGSSIISLLPTLAQSDPEQSHIQKENGLRNFSPVAQGFLFGKSIIKKEKKLKLIFLFRPGFHPREVINDVVFENNNWKDAETLAYYPSPWWEIIFLNICPSPELPDFPYPPPRDHLFRKDSPPNANPLFLYLYADNGVLLSHLPPTCATLLT